MPSPCSRTPRPARILRLLVAAGLALGLALPTAALAASPDPGYPNGPPYGPSRNPDGEWACDGGFYSVPTWNGDRYVRCLGVSENRGWERFSAETTVGATTATITIRRLADGAPALVGFATEPGTAAAGTDYTAVSGELYFRDSETVRTLTIPIVRDPQAPSDRSFGLRLSDPVNLRLTLPNVTVTIPGHPPAATAPPAISGIARADEALTATDGDWQFEPTFTRAWERCDADGDDCTPIDGATASDYDPVAADVGHRLRVSVTASNGSGSDVARSTPTAIVRPALAPPTITAGPEGVTEERTSSFSVAGEAGASFECRLDEQVLAACSSPHGVTGLTAGEHHFEVRQRADDGAVSALASRSWTVLPLPTPAPPTFAYGPDEFTVSTSVGFTLGGEAGTSFRCRLDGAAAAACNASVTFSGLSVGPHRLEVVQRNVDGADSAPATREWTVVPTTDPGRAGPPFGSGRVDGDEACDGGLFDVVAVRGDRYVRCLSAGAFPWQQFGAETTVAETTATITITRPRGSAPAAVGFATVPGTATAGRDYTAVGGQLFFATGQTVRTLAVSIVRDPEVVVDRRFRVALFDASGLGLRTTDATVTIPASRPAASTPPTQTGPARVGETLTGSDGSWTGSPDARSFGWQRCDADGDGCAEIDDATATTYVPTAADVDHRLRFAVTASNAAGPTTAVSSPTAVVRAALGAPEITTHPPTTTADRAASFGFDGEAGASFECRLDEQPFAACTSPAAYNGLRSVGHRFEVRQRGEDGVLSPVAGYDWTVQPGPDPEHPDGPPYSDGTPPDGNRLCLGGPFDAIVRDGDGYVRCWDDGGLNQDWRVFTAAVDTTPSTATVTVRRQFGAGPALVGFATVAGTATEGRDFTATGGELYFAAGQAERTITVPLRRDQTASADRRFTVALSDLAGIGLRLPAATVDLPGNLPVVVTPPSVAGVARAGQELTGSAGSWDLEPDRFASSWLRCDADGDACTTIDAATDSRYVATAADVGHRIRYVETAGNGAGETPGRSAPTALIRAAVVAPTITAAPDVETEATSARFAFGGEAGASFACRLDDGAFAACTSPVDLTGLGLGEHRFEVRQRSDDELTSAVAVHGWTVVASTDPPGPGTGPEPGDGGGTTPTTPAPPSDPPAVPTPPAPPAPRPPDPPSVPRTPVRMTTIRMQLVFCAGCSRLSARDQARLRRVRGRVDGARLLAIDGYGDRGRSSAANRRLSRARTRAVERLLLAGVRERPARLAVVAHERPSPATERRSEGAARERRVTVKIVVRR